MRFSELEGARVGVWGAGREIVSFAAQMHRRLPAARIVAAAFDEPPDAAVLETLKAPGARVLTAQQAIEGLAGCKVVVRSPGVPTRKPELLALREAGVHVTTATALWLAERDGQGVIGVTGTKGKSTTAALIAHLARAQGRSVDLAGNIGAPALDLLDGEPAEVTVIELSSYQIADLDVGPEIALVTNLYKEHTAWHGSEEAYRADKLRLLGLPGVSKVVLNGRDKRLALLAGGDESMAVGRDRALVVYGVPDGWDVQEDGGIAFAGKRAARADELLLPGAHNALNICGALTALGVIGISVADPADALRDFSGLPHRLETVAERGGVLWVNDSISTTPESALAALASFQGRDVVLIAGGQDRGQDYGKLADVLAASGAGVIGVPSTGSRLIAATREAGVPPARAIEANDLEAAIAIADSLTSSGSIVLLSPAAPSYDHYRDFEQRGERFAALVLEAGPDSGS